MAILFTRESGAPDAVRDALTFFSFHNFLFFTPSFPLSGRVNKDGPRGGGGGDGGGGDGGTERDDSACARPDAVITAAEAVVRYTIEKSRGIADGLQVQTKPLDLEIFYRGPARFFRVRSSDVYRRVEATSSVPSLASSLPAEHAKE